MTKKKVAAFFTAAALCGALAVGSSMAYLTDHDLSLIHISEPTRH